MAKNSRGENALKGAATGAATGALVGSVIPGVGTAVGAGVGGVVGGLGGAFQSELGLDKLDPTKMPKPEKVGVSFDAIPQAQAYKAKALNSEYSSGAGANAVNDSLAKMGLNKFNQDAYINALDTMVTSNAINRRDADAAKLADEAGQRKISGGAARAGRLLASAEAARTAAIGKAGNRDSAEKIASAERGQMLNAAQNYSDAMEKYRQNAYGLESADRQFAGKLGEEQRQYNTNTGDSRKSYIASLEQAQNDAELQRQLGIQQAKMGVLNTGLNTAGTLLGLGVKQSQANGNKWNTLPSSMGA